MTYQIHPKRIIEYIKRNDRNGLELEIKRLERMLRVEQDPRNIGTIKAYKMICKNALKHPEVNIPLIQQIKSGRISEEQRKNLAKINMGRYKAFHKLILYYINAWDEEKTKLEGIVYFRDIIRSIKNGDKDTLEFLSSEFFYKMFDYGRVIPEYIGYYETFMEIVDYVLYKSEPSVSFVPQLIKLLKEGDKKGLELLDIKIEEEMKGYEEAELELINLAEKLKNVKYNHF